MATKRKIALGLRWFRERQLMLSPMSKKNLTKVR
jgi:hypothetical protein